jgi:hypothetical protein
MQVSEARMPSRPAPSPNWVSWTLVAGSAILLVWGFYVLTFLSEPSAVGRLLAALVLIGGGCIVTAVLGIAGAAGVSRRTSWGRSVALVASILMTLSVVGAVAGIPALIGTLSGRDSDSN